jgi:hypothetical protein
MDYFLGYVLIFRVRLYEIFQKRGEPQNAIIFYNNSSFIFQFPTE